ncbi:MAG: acyl-CoA dehydrogenase, partial [bacterium]|nr:acyl-CoA dehydrogenase [bacterium]
MEILNYTEEHQNFRKRLRSFLAEEVTPFADQWEQDRIVPKSVWKKMGQGGFLCTDVAPEYGGLGGDFLYSLIVAEEMAQTRQTGLIAPLHSDIVVPYISSFGSEELKKKYLPGCVSGDIITAVAMTESGAGSDLAGMQTAALEEGNEVVIDGSKTFISNGL